MFGDIWVFNTRRNTFEKQRFAPALARPAQRQQSNAITRTDPVTGRAKLYVYGGVSSKAYLNGTLFPSCRSCRTS
jgi:hypothetical protein